jgi:hypothetical protein
MTNTKRDWLAVLNANPGEPAVVASPSGNFLIIPPLEYTETGEQRNFTNIGTFTENASPTVQKAFWRKVAETLEYIVQNTTLTRIWVYTEGAGVAYLHVRICHEPGYQKYFRDV